MDTGLSTHDLDIIKNTLAKFPAVRTATLFGSRAKGTYKHGSDIDIAIELTQSESSTTNLLHDALEEETPLPYFFDVVDYSTIENQELIDHIDRVGIRLYQSPL